MIASPVQTIRRAKRAARNAEQAAALVDLLPLPPNAEELRLILDSIPGSQLPFHGNVRKQWHGAVRWLAWELARRGVRAPPFSLPAAPPGRSSAGAATTGRGS